MRTVDFRQKVHCDLQEENHHKARPEGIRMEGFGEIISQAHAEEICQRGEEEVEGAGEAEHEELEIGELEIGDWRIDDLRLKKEERGKRNIVLRGAWGELQDVSKPASKQNDFVTKVFWLVVVSVCGVSRRYSTTELFLFRNMLF